MLVRLRWILGLTIVAMIAGVPYVHYRATYAHAKRMREVTPDRFYRCGQLTADGFRETIPRYGIRTVINLQHEATDPMLPDSYYRSKPAILESELCEQLGARYVQLTVDLLPRPQAEKLRPEVIDEYLKILDDPKSYPILLHCKAGLHRTGLLTAIYRMEYEHWPKADATRELRANGFGDFACTTADDYVYEYLYLYEPRWQGKPAKEGGMVKDGSAPKNGGPP